MKVLPPRCNLDQLKKQAKELVKSVRAGEPFTWQRVQSILPRLRPRLGKSFSLHDAQWVIAREYGFDSWPKLKCAVEDRSRSFGEIVSEFVAAAFRGDQKRAAELLEREPEIARADLPAACLAGEYEFVADAVSRDAGLVQQRGGPKNCTPLVYVCFSGFLRHDMRRAKQLVRIARLLLEAGADPNASVVLGAGASACRLSALYGAAGRANHAEMTELLLKAGANPNDGESLYHSAEFKDHTCMRLLLQHGAKVEGTNAAHRKLDFNDLQGLRILLGHGAHGNLTNHKSDTLLHWAILNGRGVPFLELLLERGADLRARNSEGLTPYELAVRLGHRAASEFLRAHHAEVELPPKERFVAAAVAGRIGEVRALLKEQPAIGRSLSRADHALLAEAAWRGRTQAVRVMLQAGFDVAARGKGGETALHNAAWMGHAATAKVLLDAGAPLEVRDSCHNATPLEWALHGAVNARTPEGVFLNRKADYAKLVELLLDAGATPPRQLCDDALPAPVLQVLARRGLIGKSSP